MIKVSYCCQEEMHCSCKVSEYSFISHTPQDIVICPNDCEVKNDIKINFQCFKRIHGCVTGKCETPLPELLVKLLKECWRCGTKVFEEVTVALTDCYGLYEFLVPCSCKDENYKVIISNTIFKETCSKDSHCHCDEKPVSSCKYDEKNTCSNKQECTHYPKCDFYKSSKNNSCGYKESNCYMYDNAENKNSTSFNSYAKDTMISTYKYYNRSYYNS